MDSPSRSAMTLTCIVIDVRPMRATVVSNRTTSPTRTGSLNSTRLSGHGDNLDGRRPAAQDDLASRRGRAGHVDVAEDHAAEDGPVRIGVSWHHHDLDGDVGVGHGVSVFAGTTVERCHAVVGSTSIVSRPSGISVVGVPSNVQRSGRPRWGCRAPQTKQQWDFWRWRLMKRTRHYERMRFHAWKPH